MKSFLIKLFPALIVLCFGLTLFIVLLYPQQVTALAHREDLGVIPSDLFGELKLQKDLALLASRTW
ncbi:MAG: hypothetical protein ERJ67_04060 [Aphanocapsa feldmannii 277cV]|uniref:Uncharacterized protein n=1 Tax=Aphanocapsa feldmannii 277cV TaxID=2507553 RepID=A0A524RPA3_9CHRO|nr:MAG: hypothetical protein ERJ67_04060 [Aphanocapsa feldmannii 277cV]